MEFITDRGELVKYGMEHRYVNKSVNAEIFNYPIFMVIKEHPLYGFYNEVKALMTTKTADEFVVGIKQRIESEPDGEKKTRVKCKPHTLQGFLHYLNFRHTQNAHCCVAVL